MRRTIAAFTKSLDIEDLAIGNFPGAGVRGSTSLYRVYLGVDPTGEKAASNERGVEGGFASVSDCVISGNRRSGIATTGGTYIHQSRIGVRSSVIARVFVEIYANRRPGTQTERYLGSLDLGYLKLSGQNHLTGTLTVDEDLSGLWITAIALRERSDTYTDIPKTLLETSEASQALRVQ